MTVRTGAELAREPGSAASLDEGRLRFATADGFAAEIFRSGVGRLLVVKVTDGRLNVYRNAADEAEAMDLAHDTIAETRSGRGSDAEGKRA